MIIPFARDCQDLVDSISTAPSAYVALAAKQIVTAVAAGTYTCTLTTSGKAVADVASIKNILDQRGYRWTQTSTTITIYYDNSAPSEIATY